MIIEVPIQNLIAGGFVSFVGGFVTCMLIRSKKEKKK